MIKKSISSETLELFDKHFAETGDSFSDLGLVSVCDHFGYFYFVPLKEKFYQQSHLEVEQVSFLSESEISVPSDNPVFSKMTAEQWMEQVLDVCKSSALWILDIGAFVGDFSLMFSSVVMRAGHLPQPLKLFAFEPNPLNINLLRANVSLNKISIDLTVVQTACSSYNGTHQFMCWNRARIGGQLLDSVDQTMPGAIITTVDVIRVEDFLDKLSIFDDDVVCVKIDTEGGEPGVIAGFGRYLQQICLCVLEYWPHTATVLVDGIPFAEYLVNHFDILTMGSSLHSKPLPWKVLSSAEELNSYAEFVLKKKKNLDIACVNKNHPLRDALISVLT